MLLKWRRFLIAGNILAIFAFSLALAQAPGEILPAWEPGVLDIHHINTGKGESALFIFPDGTTMLVDAGATTRRGPRVTPQRPDDSRTSGEWIVHYIRQMLAHWREPSLDYAVITHFHDDHMGAPDKNSKKSSSGDYLLAGITEVGEQLRIAKILDRGWPDYNWPQPLDNSTMNNYRKFLKWQIEHRGTVVERFQPGREDQIVLCRDPGKYPGFRVRNIAVNGEVWEGEGTRTRRLIPPLEEIADIDKPSENMLCAVMVISYGKFDYYNGADIPGVPEEGAPRWHDIETPVARVVGPVDVHLVDHHGFIDAANAFFLRTLRPRVHIIQLWAPSHPSHRVLNRLLSRRLYPGDRDIFTTNLMQATRIVIGSALDRLKSSQGHIVVRVAPGGGSYRVIILDDSGENCKKVKAVFGPYESR